MENGFKITLCLLAVYMFISHEYISAGLLGSFFIVSCFIKDKTVLKNIGLIALISSSIVIGIFTKNIPLAICLFLLSCYGYYIKYKK